MSNVLSAIYYIFRKIIDCIFSLYYAPNLSLGSSILVIFTFSIIMKNLLQLPQKAAGLSYANNKREFTKEFGKGDQHGQWMFK